MTQLGLMMHLTPDEGQSATHLYQQAGEVLARLEQQGLQEAWITEHHFNAHSLCPSPMLLMSALLAKTQHIKLGSAAVLLGFHQPLDIVEQIATLSALYPDRVLMGFAKGGPFESQNKAFGVAGDVSRARMIEALPAMQALLLGESNTHAGEHYTWQEIDLQPKPASTVPFFVASSDEQAIAQAAGHGFGLMIAQFWPAQKINLNRDTYQRYSGGIAPDIMAARGVLIDNDGQQARDKALAFIHDFRSQRAQIWGNHKGPMTGVSDEDLLARMLVGNVEEVIEQTRGALATGITRLAINPLTTSLLSKAAQAQRFMHEVWPACQ